MKPLFFPKGKIRENFFYLATPYTHPDKHIMNERAAEALIYSGLLLEQNLFNFSPIAYCHPIAKARAFPTDAQWWWDFNLTFMKHAAGMIIAQMDGWRESNGIKREVEWFKEETLPIFMVKRTPDGLVWD